MMDWTRTKTTLKSLSSFTYHILWSFSYLICYFILRTVFIHINIPLTYVDTCELEMVMLKYKVLISGSYFNITKKFRIVHVFYSSVVLRCCCLKTCNATYIYSYNFKSFFFKCKFYRFKKRLHLYSEKSLVVYLIIVIHLERENIWCTIIVILFSKHHG